MKPEDGPLKRKAMTIGLSERNGLGKEARTILDMLYTNNWGRPMYYESTVDSGQFVKLDNYFQKTGLAYRIVPFNARAAGSRAIDTEKMYDNVINKFKYGGLDKPGVYVDENTMRMCKSYRVHVFSELAGALLQENKNEKALAVLDKAMQVLPPENVPYDYSSFTIGELYLLLGEKDKGEQILNGIAENSMRSLRWFTRLSPDKLAGVENELGYHLSVMRNVLAVGLQNNPDFGKAYRDEYNNYRMSYMQQAQPANQ